MISWDLGDLGDKYATAFKVGYDNYISQIHFLLYFCSFMIQKSIFSDKTTLTAEKNHLYLLHTIWALNAFKKSIASSLFCLYDNDRNYVCFAHLFMTTIKWIFTDFVKVCRIEIYHKCKMIWQNTERNIHN